MSSAGENPKAIPGTSEVVETGIATPPIVAHSSCMQKLTVGFADEISPALKAEYSKLVPASP